MIRVIFTNKDINKFSNYLFLDHWEAFTICHSNNKLAYLDLYDQDYCLLYHERKPLHHRNCESLLIQFLVFLY